MMFNISSQSVIQHNCTSLLAMRFIARVCLMFMHDAAVSAFLNVSGYLFVFWLIAIHKSICKISWVVI